MLAFALRVVGAPFSVLPSEVLTVRAVVVCDVVRVKGCISAGLCGSVTVPAASVPAGFRTYRVTSEAAASQKPVGGA